MQVVGPQDGEEGCATSLLCPARLRGKPGLQLSPTSPPPQTWAPGFLRAGSLLLFFAYSWALTLGEPFLRADYGPTFTQNKGVTDPLRPCRPSLRPPQGPDVRLPTIVTFRRGEAAARDVIGPLPKTDAEPKQVTTASKGLRGPCVA